MNNIDIIEKQLKNNILRESTDQISSINNKIQSKKKMKYNNQKEKLTEQEDNMSLHADTDALQNQTLPALNKSKEKFEFCKRDNIINRYSK